MIAGAIAVAAALSMTGIAQPEISPDVIGTVLQVQGALLGLAVAVSVFAYQSIEPATGSHRRLILLTGYPATIVVGLSLVLLNGASFVNQTTEFTGWLGTIAVALSGGWVMLLLLTLSDAPRLQDRRFGIGMRLRVLRRNTAHLVRRQLVVRASAVVLRQRMTAAGGRYDPWLASAAPVDSIASPRAGLILDINLRKMEQAAREIAEQGGELRLAVGLDQRVGGGAPLATANVAVPPRVRARVEEAVVFGGMPMLSIDDDLSDLHAEALSFLGGGNDILEDILEAYYGVLEQYAVAWQSFVAVLEAGNLPGWLEGQHAPTAPIRDSVARLFKTAVEGRLREAAFSLIYFPIGVMQRAIRWRAPGYFDFLSMYPNFYWLATREWVPTEMRSIFRERAWWHPVEAKDLILPALVRQSPDAQELVERADRVLDETILTVLRSCIREGDWDNFEEGLRRWRIANR